MAQSADIVLNGDPYMLVGAKGRDGYTRSQDGIDEGRTGRIQQSDFFGGLIRPFQLERDRGWNGATVGPAHGGQGVSPWPFSDTVVLDAGTPLADFAWEYPSAVIRDHVFFAVGQYLYRAASIAGGSWATPDAGVGCRGRQYDHQPLLLRRQHPRLLRGSRRCHPPRLPWNYPRRALRGRAWSPYRELPGLCDLVRRTGGGIGRLRQHVADGDRFRNPVSLGRFPDQAPHDRPGRSHDRHQRGCLRLLRARRRSRNPQPRHAPARPHRSPSLDGRCAALLPARNRHLCRRLPLHHSDSAVAPMPGSAAWCSSTIPKATAPDGAIPVSPVSVAMAPPSVPGISWSSIISADSFSELWAWDGSGWWVIHRQEWTGSDELLQPIPLAGTGGYDLGVIQRGTRTMRRFRLVWRSAIQHNYPLGESQYITSLIDASERDKAKAWRKIGAVFASPDVPGNPLSTDQVELWLDYSTDAGAIWTNATSAVIVGNSLASNNRTLDAAVASDVAVSRFLMLRVRWTAVGDWAPILVGSVGRVRGAGFTGPAASLAIYGDGTGPGDRPGRVGPLTRSGREQITELWDHWQDGTTVPFRDLDYDDVRRGAPGADRGDQRNGADPAPEPGIGGSRLYRSPWSRCDQQPYEAERPYLSYGRVLCPPTSVAGTGGHYLASSRCRQAARRRAHCSFDRPISQRRQAAINSM